MTEVAEVVEPVELEVVEAGDRDRRGAGEVSDEDDSAEEPGTTVVIGFDDVTEIVEQTRAPKIIVFKK